MSFLIDIKVYKIILKRFTKNIHKFDWFEHANRICLKNKMLLFKLKLVSSDRLIVCPNTCRSFDIFKSFHNSATALKHRGSFFYFYLGLNFSQCLLKTPESIAMLINFSLVVWMICEVSMSIVVALVNVSSRLISRNANRQVNPLNSFILKLFQTCFNLLLNMV